MFSIDSNNNIEFTIGDTASLHVALYNIDGSKYSITDGDIIRFTIADQYCGNIVVQKDSASQIIPIYPSDTSNLISGVYIYDIKLITQSNDVYTPIGPSEFKMSYGTHIVKFPDNIETISNNSNLTNQVLSVSGVIV